MVNDPLGNIATRERPSAKNYGTPQSKPSRNTPSAQVQNRAGGYVFKIDPLAQLRRFLTLGVDGGTYYASAKDLAVENAKVVFAFAEGKVDGVEDSHRVLVDEIVAISTAGRAPKQNPALFALAVAASNGQDHERRYALQNLRQVARTATHLFLWLNYVQNFRGWGPALVKYVGEWFVGTAAEPRNADNLAYQVVKYRSREGWTHRDVLRKAHPRTTDPHTKALFEWVCQRQPDVDALPRIVQGFIKAQAVDTTVSDQRALVAEYGLPWETLTDAALTEAATWRTLIDTPNALPLGALLRQLPRLTKLDLLTVGRKDNRLEEVIRRLTDAEYLHKSRIHPINVLVALRTYAGGMSARGSSQWVPSQPVVDALDKAFYASFKNVEPTGKRIRFACDTSGSMTSAVSGLPLSCVEAVAALTLVSANVEREYDIVRFSAGSGGGWGRSGANSGLASMGISPRMRLDQAMREASNSAWGGTDCSLPITDAMAKNLNFDAFVILTDNDTWAGNIHPFEALKKYRAKTGIHDAKMIVVAMTSMNYSIADPSDANMLDVSGFDSTVPNVIGDFIRG